MQATNARLNKGDEIKSANGVFRAIMQDDGNFVVYDRDSLLWASNTVGKGDHLIFQEDGNLVVFREQTAIWTSNTQHRGKLLIM